MEVILVPCKLMLKFERAEMQMIRWMWDVSTKDRNTSEELRKMVGAEPCCCCCGLPTPMTLASGVRPMFPLVVHQPAYPSIWAAVHSLWRGLSTNPGVTMWYVCGCS